MDPHLDSDSDEAPEEISLNKGREEAEQFRKNEKDNLKRLAEVKKEKRKAQLEKKQEIELEKKKKQEEKKAALEKKIEKNQRKKVRQLAKKGIEVGDADATTDTKPAPVPVPEKSRSRKRKSEQTDDGAPESAGKIETETATANKVVGSVMLDDKVVQLIRAREKQVEKSGGIAKHKYIREPEPEPEHKKAKPSKPSKFVSKNSRVQIVSLKRKPDASALKKALKFRDQRLFGKATHRSMTMLPRTFKRVSV
jgi:hypothetical protein